MTLQKHINNLFNSISYRIHDCIIDQGEIWNGCYGIKTILLTHAHFDHIYGLNDLLKIIPDIWIYTNDCGKNMLLDAKKNLSYYHGHSFVFENPERIITIKDRADVIVGENTKATAVFTPGHNPSCITWVISEALFTGDSYIPGIKTVTNLPNGNRQQAFESEQLIKTLSIGRTIFPGHKIENGNG